MVHPALIHAPNVGGSDYSPPKQDLRLVNRDVSIVSYGILYADIDYERAYLWRLGSLVHRGLPFRRVSFFFLVSSVLNPDFFLSFHLVLIWFQTSVSFWFQWIPFTFIYCIVFQLLRINPNFTYWPSIHHFFELLWGTPCAIDSRLDLITVFNWRRLLANILMFLGLG